MIEHFSNLILHIPALNLAAVMMLAFTGGQVAQYWIDHNYVHLRGRRIVVGLLWLVIAAGTIVWIKG